MRRYVLICAWAFAAAWWLYATVCVTLGYALTGLSGIVAAGVTACYCANSLRRVAAPPAPVDPDEEA